MLLHGGPGCCDYFSGSALVDWLAPIRTVHSYDQRGCRNSPSAGPFTLAANVEDLEAIRDWIGAERIDLLGHSAGGGSSRAGRCPAGRTLGAISRTFSMETP